METQMKQRITGIVVLLILIAAVVLLLFYGARQDKKVDPVNADIKTEQQLTEIDSSATPKDVVANNEQAQTPEIPEKFGQLEGAKKVLLKNNEDDSNAAANNNPLSDTAISNNTPTTNDVLTNNSVNEATPDAKIQAPIEENTKALEQPKDEPVVAPTPVVEKATEEKPTKPVVAKMLPKKKVAVHTWKGKWAVRLGTFSEPPNAVKLVNKLRNKGYHTYTRLVITKSKGVLTQVFVGPSTKGGANRLVKELKSKFKLKGIVVSK